MKNLKGIIVDPETGEIIEEVYAGDRLLREKSLKHLRDERERIPIGEEQPFVKTFTNTIRELSEELSGTETWFLIYLAQYISYNSGILCHNGNNSMVSRDSIAMETGLSYQRIDSLVDSLVKKQIIGKHRTGQSVAFTVNPFIFMRGKKVNQTLYRLYCRTKWAKMHGVNE